MLQKFHVGNRRCPLHQFHQLVQALPSSEMKNSGQEVHVWDSNTLASTLLQAESHPFSESGPFHFFPCKRVYPALTPNTSLE